MYISFKRFKKHLAYKITNPQRIDGSRRMLTNQHIDIVQRFTAAINHHQLYIPLSGTQVPIGIFSSLNGWVAASARLGNLATLSLPLLAFVPNYSIMYFHPSIIFLLLNICRFIKLVIFIPQQKLKKMNQTRWKWGEKLEICWKQFDVHTLEEECLILFRSSPKCSHLVPLTMFPTHLACLSHRKNL